MTGAGPAGQGQQESLEGALQIVAATPSILARLLPGLPAEWLAPSQPGERADWAPREVVEHLLDVEGVAFAQRMGRIVQESQPLIRSIDPSRRLAQAGWSQRSLADLLEELRQRREQDVAWVRGLSAPQLERTGRHDVAGTISARQLVHYWATHDLVHLGQLMRGLRGPLEAHIGGMDAFLEE